DAGVGENETKCREFRWIDRHHRLVYLKSTQQLTSVQRPRTTKCQQSKVSRVKASLRQNRAQKTYHIVVGDLDYRERRLLEGPSRVFPYGLEGLARRGGIKIYPTAEEIIRMEPAEQDIRIRHSWKSAAPRVTGGARFSTSALRPPPKHSPFIYPRD